MGVKGGKVQESFKVPAGWRDVNKDNLQMAKSRMSFFCGLVFVFSLRAAVVNVPPVDGNATFALRTAIESLSDGDVLKLEKGDYHLYSDGTVAIPLGPSGNLAGVKNVALPFRGKRDLTIDGGGARLVVHAGVFPFIADSMDSVVVRNLSVRAAVPSVAEFRTVAVDDDGFELDFSSSAPAFTIQNGAMLFDLSGEWRSSRDHKFSLHGLDVNNLRIFYLFCGGHDENRDALVVPYVGANATSCSGRRVRFELKNETHAKRLERFPFEVGSDAAMLIESDRHRDQFLFQHSRNVHVENVVIESGVGMGFVVQMCENVKFRNVKTAHPPEMHMALTADTIYISSCKGTIDIGFCEFNGGLDDPLNIPEVYLVLSRIEGRRITVDCWRDGLRDGIFPFSAGDEIEIFSGNGSCRHRYDIARITAFERPSALAKSCTIELDRELPKDRKGLLIGNVSHLPLVHVHHNRFSNVLTSRYSANADVTIENNVYHRCRNVIYIDDLVTWAGEGGPIRRLTVRNNRVQGMNPDKSFVFNVPTLTTPVLDGNVFE